LNLPSLFLAVVFRIVPVFHVEESARCVIQPEFDPGLEYGDKEVAIGRVLAQVFEDVGSGFVRVFVRPVGCKKLDRPLAFRVGLSLVWGRFEGQRKVGGATANAGELAEDQPGAALAACAYGRLDATVLFDAPPNTETAGASRSATAPGEEDGLISAIVIRDVRPLHPQRFYDLDREHLSNKLRDTHSVFGDRARELTLIGLPRDRDRFVASLRDCFCTEAEIARWQAGGDFPDPRPKWLKLLQ